MKIQLGRSDCFLHLHLKEKLKNRLSGYIFKFSQTMDTCGKLSVVKCTSMFSSPVMYGLYGLDNVPRTSRKRFVTTSSLKCRTPY